MNKSLLFRTAACIATAVMIGAPGLLHARDVAPVATPPAGGDVPEMGEIIVTAQKRAESAQNVPIAISAVSGEALAKSGISGLEGLQTSVPNLSIGQTTGTARIALRGVGSENLGTGAEGSIAFHVNGVFIARTAAALSSFYDIDRIEVLRGPQGTLYGRNATSGAINVITRRPTRAPEGYVNFTYGNYDSLKVEGAVSGPIVEDRILARFAFLSDNHDGYGRNIVTGKDIDNARRISARGAVEFLPTDRLSLLVTADYHHENDRNYAYHFFDSVGQDAAGNPITPTGILAGGITAPDRRDIASERNPKNVRNFWGVSAELSWDLDFGQVRSLTAYRRTKYLTETDLDQTSVAIASPLIQSEDSRQFSQELQVSGNTDRLNWLLGVYYFHEKDVASVGGPFSTVTVGGPLPGYLAQGIEATGPLFTDAAAAFGQLTYEVLPDLRVTLGARYSWEQKKVDNVIQLDFVRPYDPSNPIIPALIQQDSQTFKAFTPRVSVDYKLDPNTLLYASFSKGFKSGNFNLGLVQPALKPEKITAYEAGVKTTLGNGLLRFNLAGFYYDYTDLQVGKVIGTFLGLENAATASIYGIEIESRLRPARNLEFDANFSWLHARFDDYISIDPARPGGDGVTTDGGVPAFNLKGNRLSQAPDFTASGGAQYRLDIGDYALTLRGELSWTDRIYFSPFNQLEVSQGPKTKGNAFITFAAADDRWSLTAFAKNIGGRRYIQNAYVNSGLVGFTVTGGLEEPRLYGMTARFKF
ncbi:TonB-dependent receptor [Sphingobium sp. 15-1]|uniref:TonB-dependent receptor n=1 Tax=Sphingobium sp. 15-1 TaxID=2729616 RepID=UPI00159CAA51|nr:TonB-dependent receptor [Sphingobium sp. 15-1]